MKPLSSVFSPEVMAELSRPVQSYDARNAEIAEGMTPTWHVFEIYSIDAEAELTKRRFGIYVPLCEETTVKRGRKVDRVFRLFPGYVFVLLWETDANWGRLASVPGIARSIGTLTEDELHEVQVCENKERPIELEYFEAETDQPAKKRKRRRRSPRPVLVPDEIVRTRAWSAFDDIVHKLDGEGRSEALRQMVGAKCVVAGRENQIGAMNAPQKQLPDQGMARSAKRKARFINPSM